MRRTYLYRPAGRQAVVCFVGGGIKMHSADSPTNKTIAHSIIIIISRPGAEKLRSYGFDSFAVQFIHQPNSK